jgi:hypothetical protein
MKLFSKIILMKKPYWYFFLIIILPIITNAQQNTTEVVQAYSGIIGGKYSIGMEIIFKDSLLTGRYQYRNKLEWLNLRGMIKGSKIFLTEEKVQYLKETESLYTVITGSFDGVMHSDSTITGTWKNADGSKNYPFVLHKERFNFSPDSIAVEVQDFSLNDCECYTGSLVKIRDKRLSAYVFNKLNLNLNEEDLRIKGKDEECPCVIDDYYDLSRMFSNSTEMVYNQNNILTCITTRTGAAVHPWIDIGYSNYNLRTGERIEPVSLFKPEAFPEIRDHIIRLLSKRLEETVLYVSLSDVDEYDIYDEYDEYKSVLCEYGESFLEREKTNTLLYEFTPGKTHLTFYANWGFKHFYTEIEPSGEIVIPYKDLLQWIDPKGALGFVLKKQ